MKKSQGIQFHIERKYRVNTTSILTPKETYHQIDALQKHQSKSSLRWWWHRLLQHCCRGLTRRYISTIFVNNLPKLHTSNNNLYHKKWFSLNKGRNRWYPAESMTDAVYADDLALPENTPAKAGFLLHSIQQVALVSMWTQIKQSSCVLNKKVLSPL